jgi:hypothetical protein
MTKTELIKKWESQYSYYLKKADEGQVELENIDMDKQWEKYKLKRIKVDSLYYLCAIISTFVKNLKECNEN